MVARLLALLVALPIDGDPVEQLRRRGMVLLAIAGWLTLAVLTGTALAIQPAAAAALLIAGAIANIGPSLMALQGRTDPQARAIAGTLAATLPALLVFLLRGYGWQLDGHMFFFVALSALIILCDGVPIAIAGALIALHHLIFQYLFPGWVFYGGGNLGRVLFHGVAVVIECGLLANVAALLRRLLAVQARAADEQRQLAEMAERLRISEAAAHERHTHEIAATEDARRRTLENRTAQERSAELMILAAEFERTVSEVARTIHNSSEGLQTLAIDLDDVAGQADREAGAAARGAADATGNIREVAAAIGDLSASVRTVAAAAGNQNRLTEAAAGEGAQSIDTIVLLDARVREIEAFLADIHDIAAKTNLLALNATIEAARAGDAGRGFAVVAGEVKSLAADAARASERINDLLGEVRSGVLAAARQIEGATGAVRDVAGAAARITGAVTEQTGYAEAIDRNIAHAASRADLIQRQMETVATAMSSAVTLSARVRGDAATLACGARDLRASTQRFVSFLREGQSAA